MDVGQEWYKHDPRAFIDGVQGMGPERIGAYIVLLDLIYARGGETKRDDRHLSGILGCSLRKAKSLTDSLIADGKIDFDGEIITNSRAKREAKSARNLSETRSKSGRKGGETSVKQSRNERETVAKPTRNEAENQCTSNKNKDLGKAKSIYARSREEDIDIELDNNPPIVPPYGGTPPNPEKQSRRGSRIDPQKPLPDDWREFARGLGFTDAGVERQYADFVDYWLGVSGQKGVKLDWLATWRKWMRRQADDQGLTQKQKPIPRIRGANQEHEDRVKQWLDDGYWSVVRFGPRPDHPGTMVPEPVLRKFGIKIPWENDNQDTETGIH